MKTEPKLGQLLTGDAERDAVHVAIAPMVAGEDLNPSERVILDKDGLAHARFAGGPPPVGIVDPFLEDCVPKGKRFWLFLFPGTVTSLRHHWTHPSFEDVLRSEPGPAGENPQKAASEQWLREYAVKLNSYHKSPQDAYESLIRGLESGEIRSYGHSLTGFEDLDDSDELAFHASVLLGRPVKLQKFYYGCSC